MQTGRRVGRHDGLAARLAALAALALAAPGAAAADEPAMPTAGQARVFVSGVPGDFAAVKTAIFDQVEQYHIDFMLSKIPMGRFVEVEEIAAMATWLASEECSFTTGAVFDISGGRGTY